MMRNVDVSPILTLIQVILVSLITLTSVWVVMLPITPNEAHTYAGCNYTVPDDDIVYIGTDVIILSIPKEDYDRQTDTNVLRGGKYICNPMQLADPDNEYVKMLADEISSRTTAYTDLGKGWKVAQFVYTQIEYNSDQDVYGTSEYWATPIETLYLRTGDCEDRSILACSIMLAMGLDAVLLGWNDHCAPGMIYQGQTYILDTDWPTTNLERNGQHPNVYDRNDVSRKTISAGVGMYLYTIRDAINKL